MFNILKWSFNGLLNTCYHEFKHPLKILSSDFFNKMSIILMVNLKCYVNDIIINYK